jgi:hypothetical protein
MNYMQDVGEQVFIVTERLNFTMPNPAIKTVATFGGPPSK